MFEVERDYPAAVASDDDVGITEAINWCINRMGEHDTLSVWTPLKSNLRNSAILEDFVDRNSRVEHMTGRGHQIVRSGGPVLMAWADMDDIGKLQRYSHGIRALCVIPGIANTLTPWVAAVAPTVLGEGTDWEDVNPALLTIVLEAMKDLTSIINHNNTIAAGDEKDDVVATLLALSDAQIPLDGDAMQGWALAHGWYGENPKLLAEYVKEINSGKRPQSRLRLDSNYIEMLRQRSAIGQ